MATITAKYNSDTAPYATLTATVTSQDIATNTSTIAYSLVLHRPSVVISTASKEYKVILNYQTVKSGTTTIGGSGDKTIASGTTTIKHNDDGTKTINLRLQLELNITWSGSKLGWLDIAGLMTLPTIFRGTTPTLSASSIDMGQSVTITLNPGASVTHTLRYTFKNQSGTITTGISSGNYSWTVPINLASQIPSSTSDTATIYCDTYSGSTLVGTKSVSITLKVPASVVPSISAVAISEATEGIAAKFGAYVQSKSTLNVAITAAGIYGSTIKSYTTYIQAVPYSGASFTSERITASGTVGVLTIVTDSRGRTAQVSNPITVVEYSSPVINSFKAWRVNNTGTADDEGTRIAVQMDFAISPVNQLNDHTYDLSYGQDSASTTFASGSASWTYAGTQTFITVYDPTISVDSTWIVKLTIEDFFGPVEYSYQIPTTFNLIDFRHTGKGIAFGKASEKDAMEIAIPVELVGDGQLVQKERQSATLLNEWTDYGSNYEEASFWKDDFGIVHIAGLIKGGATTAETIIFTLPEGYRPRASEKFFAVSLNAICVLDIYANGNVAIKTGANSGWLSLSGIQFRTS